MRSIKALNFLFLVVLAVNFCSPVSVAISAESGSAQSNAAVITNAVSVNEVQNPTVQENVVTQQNEIQNLQNNNIETIMPVSIPQFLIVTAANEVYIYTPKVGETSFDDQNVKAEVVYLGNDQWKLNITAKKDIAKVWFPWEDNATPLTENKSEEMYYYPYLSGITEKVWVKDKNGNPIYKKNPNAWGWSLEYPGSIFAPLVVMASNDAARMVAALNWPPKKVRPVYAAERMALVYATENLKANTSDSFGALITQVNADLSKGEVPWQMALDKYREWLDPKMTDVEYPEWMWQSEGFLEYGLNNVYHAPGSAVDVNNIIQNVQELLDLWGGELDHVQFWGQMGGYAGYIPQGSMVNPWEPEGGTCCGLNQNLYEGYGSGFIDFVHQLIKDGYHAGFYSAPYYGLEENQNDRLMLDTPEGYAWLEDWLAKNQDEYGANAFYIDVLGRGYFGDPAYVMSLFDTLIPDSSIIEGMVDIYASAGLISGSLNGGLWSGSTFANFGRYLLNDRIVYLGGSNGDHIFWGKYNDYRAERQVFLLGAKFDAATVIEKMPDGNPILNADGSLVRNQAMDKIIQLRNNVDWWARRPEYLDTKGLTGIPEGIDIRRFKDKDGKDLVVVDNWSQIAGKSFYIDGIKIFISSDQLSIVDVEKAVAVQRGDANLDGWVDGADYTVWADHYGKKGESLPGDFNFDQVVDGADYTIWADHYSPRFTPPAVPLSANADANGDGWVDGGDATLFMDNVGKPNPDMRADFNKDGRVDWADYTVWMDQYKPKPDVPTVPTTSNKLDLNSDGLVNFSDYKVWQNTYANPASAYFGRRNKLIEDIFFEKFIKRSRFTFKEDS